MAILSKGAYERKQAWADRRMDENRKAETLTEVQHDALAWLCSYRHELHCNHERLFSAEFSGEYDPEKINDRLREAGLPEFEDLPNPEDIPSDMDYFELMSDEEREEWERKADEFNKDNPDSTMQYNGFSYWIEMSYEHANFINLMNEANDAIECYLAEIDNEHGTNFSVYGIAKK